MRQRVFAQLAPVLITILLSGCAAPACISILPITGSAYDGYVVWKSGEATRYYAFDLDTTYRAVMRASAHLKLETTVITSVPKERYTLETKGKVPMRIDIQPRETGVTAVIIDIATFGDKDYVQLFYRLIEDNLPKKGVVGKGKTQ